MPNKEPKSLKSMVQENLSELAQLSQQAQHQQKLHKQVCALLPESYRQHVVAVSIKDDIMTIVSDSASWATRLRFYSQMLLQNLVIDHKSSETPKSISVKVRPHWHPN